MTKFKVTIISCITVCFGCNQQVKKLPRIAIAGLGIESSTFSPARSGEDAFHVWEKQDIFGYYPFFKDDSALLKRADWTPTRISRSLPGGAVTLEAYESIVGKTLTLLEQGKPYDGLFLDIHGAMSVDGLDDPEGDQQVDARGEAAGQRPEREEHHARKEKPADDQANPAERRDPRFLHAHPRLGGCPRP